MTQPDDPAMTTAPRPAARPAASAARLGGTRSAKTKLAAVAVVCTRCAKRQGLRPRAVRALLKAAAGIAARRTAREGGRKRKLCIVETRCLGPCPKRAVAVATGTSLAAGRVLLLDPGAGPEAAVAALLPEFGPNTGLAAGRPDESSATA